MGGIMKDIDILGINADLLAALETLHDAVNAKCVTVGDLNKAHTAINKAKSVLINDIRIVKNLGVFMDKKRLFRIEVIGTAGNVSATLDTSSLDVTRVDLFQEE
jgi:hypothetical protein